MIAMPTFPPRLAHGALVLAAVHVVCLAPLAPRGCPVALAVVATGMALGAAVVCLAAVTLSVAMRPDPEKALLAVALIAGGLSFLLRWAGHRAPVVEIGFDLSLAVAAAAGGRLFALQVQEAWWLVPLGLTATVADLASVLIPGGPTQQMLESKSRILDYLLLTWPNLSGEGARGFLGVSDLVVAAILQAHSQLFSMDPARTARVLTGALLACLLAANLLGLGLPAIPFMAVAYVYTHRAALWTSYQHRKDGPNPGGMGTQV